jgi:uncharacterized protein
MEVKHARHKYEVWSVRWEAEGKMASGKGQLVQQSVRSAKRSVSRFVGALVLAVAMAPAHADMAEDHAKAIKLWEIGNVVDAMTQLTAIAEKGYAPSQVWLATIMDQAQQDDDAVKWFRKAADQGDPAGEYGLGLMYGKGEGIKQDNAKALEFVTRAAEKNYSDAVFALAAVYTKGGFGVEPNAEKGEFWTARAKALAPEEPKQETGKKKRRK